VGEGGAIACDTTLETSLHPHGQNNRTAFPKIDRQNFFPNKLSKRAVFLKLSKLSKKLRSVVGIGPRRLTAPSPVKNLLKKKKNIPLVI